MVLCVNGLQFIPNKLVALCDIKRVLVPGGRLAFAVRMAIGQEVSTALQAYRDGDDVVYPLQLHLVQARTP